MIHAPSTQARQRPNFDLAVLLLLVAAPLACGVAIATGAIQDYGVHLRLWLRVLQGADPYLTSVHAYGPAFNALAPLLRLHPLAPKLFFVVVWFGFAWWLVELARRERPEGSRLPLWTALLLLNPWLWSEVAIYGHFDVTVAVACVLAVHGVRGGRFQLAAALLSLGILLKFFPAVLLPSLAFDSQRSTLRLGPLVTCVLLSGVAFGITYAFYGSSMLEPFRFGGTRPSSGFSIFEYLRGPASFLRWFTPAPDLDAWSTPALLAAAGATTVVVLARRIDAATSALLLMLAVLTLYRAGHSQFQVIPLLLAAYWLVVHGAEMSGRWLVFAFGIYLAWLWLETAAWVSGPWPWFESLDGLVHFLVAANLFSALLLHGLRPGTAGPGGPRTLRIAL